MNLFTAFKYYHDNMISTYNYGQHPPNSSLNVCYDDDNPSKMAKMKDREAFLLFSLLKLE